MLINRETDFIILYWCPDEAYAGIHTAVTVSSDTSHYSEVMMIAMSSQITGVMIVWPTVCASIDQRKHQRSALLAPGGESTSDRWIPHKAPVTRILFSFDDVIMFCHCYYVLKCSIPYFYINCFVFHVCVKQTFLKLKLKIIMNASRRIQKSLYWRHVPWGHKLPAIKVFVLQLVQANNKENSTLLASVMGNRRFLVDSPHKGPVIRKSFLCHDVYI